ncbi:MAG: hypothetical protein QOC96_2119 [Acidobacteriota bacterium]|jgi:hypothetical protein|nr:hypothetical protein [Acidobacteriota bacterium]
MMPTTQLAPTFSGGPLVIGRRRGARHRFAIEEVEFSIQTQNLSDLTKIQSPATPDLSNNETNQLGDDIPSQTAASSDNPEEEIDRNDVNGIASISRQIKQWRAPRTNIISVRTARPRHFRPQVRVLSENARQALGANGLRRLFEFSEYRVGWDAGRGQPLSIGSLSSLEWFLDRLPELSAIEPSLFLTRNGNLQLVFEDHSGNAIEIEFFPDKLEYYFEDNDEEGFIQLSDVNGLIDRLRIFIA